MKIYFAAALLGTVIAGGSAWAQAPNRATLPLAAATAPTGSEHAGLVKTVRGSVQLLAADGTARNAQAGDTLASIDRIVTEADSAASVVLRDGTTMVVGPSSRLDIKDFHFDPTTQDGSLLVSLLRGSMRMITGLIGKHRPDAVRIETQTATIGIRGTDFIVEADPQQ